MSTDKADGGTVPKPVSKHKICDGVQGLRGGDIEGRGLVGVIRPAFKLAVTPLLFY